MVVQSGQMPYEFDAPLPIRAPRGAWPGLSTPNIGLSGITIEQAMFVYNAEIRKWNPSVSLSDVQYNLYSHPDITPSGFEPKANGDTLEGLVGGIASLESVDNIEELRDQMDLFLFPLYANDSEYLAADFKEAWLQTAYPESPSGGYVVADSFFGEVISGRDFLHPSLEDVVNGDFITTTDDHWLGGSGVIYDIDCGEVVFNPFPFPRNSFFSIVGSDSQAFHFGPVYPLVQTTLGGLPSVVPSRYLSDVPAGDFINNTNFNAIQSGIVQIDGYALLNGTTIELVNGNDENFGQTVSFSNDYSTHVQGLRVVNNDAGVNDSSARCYRTPSVQSSGLYRLLTQNQKSDVPFTAIPSGFVSLWPQGLVRKLNADGTLATSNLNFIHGRELTVASDGGLLRDASASDGIHVMDDTFWITTPNDSSTSGALITRGLYICSQFNGELIWYRPAELGVSNSGTAGPGPSTFYTHLGMMDIGTDWVRIARTASLWFDTDIGTPTPNSDVSFFTLNFQSYNKTTLNHTETIVEFMVGPSEDATLVSFGAGGVDGGSVLAGTDVWVYMQDGDAFRFDTSLNFVDAYVGPDVGRRHYADAQMLYTAAGSLTIEVGDPLNSINGGPGSGIGVWSATPGTGPPADVVGLITHDSAKPFRGETLIGWPTNARAVWHDIFDVAGSTHVANGVWGLLQVEHADPTLYLVRMTEETTHWQAREAILLEHTPEAFGGTSPPADFPYEVREYDID